MRLSLVLVPALLLAGCAYLPVDATRVQLTARDGGTLYQGTIKRVLPAVVTITVEVDRRIYSGNLEVTFSNETFGLFAAYAPRDAAQKTAQELALTTYTKAILSSSDQRVLKCDFTDTGGNDAVGLCVDESKRVYDVKLS